MPLKKSSGAAPAGSGWNLTFLLLTKNGGSGSIRSMYDEAAGAFANVDDMGGQSSDTGSYEAAVFCVPKEQYDEGERELFLQRD